MKLTALCITYLVLFLYYIPTYWKIFCKFGRRGWEGIIPVYNQYIFYKETWTPKFFWFNLIMIFFSCIFTVAYSFTEVAGYNLAVVIFSLVRLIIQLMLCGKIAKTFGKGNVFAVGLYFFPFICYPILAFGSAMPKNRIYTE